MIQDNTFVLTHIHEEFSRKNSQRFYELEFVTGWPLRTARMYVSPDNYNWRNWREYVLHWNPKYTPVFTDLVYKNIAKHTLDADPRPHYHSCTDLQEFLNLVLEAGG